MGIIYTAYVKQQVVLDLRDGSPVADCKLALLHTSKSSTAASATSTQNPQGDCTIRGATSEE